MRTKSEVLASNAYYPVYSVHGLFARFAARDHENPVGARVFDVAHVEKSGVSGGALLCDDAKKARENGPFTLRCSHTRLLRRRHVCNVRKRQKATTKRRRLNKYLTLICGVFVQFD